MRIVRVGLAGLGTVGFGTYAVLTENAQEITARTGTKIEVRCAVVRDAEKARQKTGGKLPIETSFLALLEDPLIDIVVEVMGGIEPAKTFVLEAIKRGKHVVTANKHLIAVHGEEIFRAARQQGVTVAYEAAVAGGIPIIKALRESLAGNRIESVSGIVNGTSNYILSMMREKGSSFSEALCEAQKLGYAEADPTFDVEGIDAAHKTTILASLAFGTPFNFNAASIEGITSIDAQDIAFAEKLGYCIKLIGQAKRTQAGIELGVHPRLVSQKSLFSRIDGVMNAVEVVADGLGPTFYAGRGAGERPTASAVVADIMDVARTMNAEPSARVAMAGFQLESRQAIPYVAASKIQSRFYVRFSKDDEPIVREAFDDSSIVVEQSRQFGDQTIAFVKKVEIGILDAALQIVSKNSSIHGSPIRLHVFDS